jgi:hypothetical protein
VGAELHHDEFIYTVASRKAGESPVNVTLLWTLLTKTIGGVDHVEFWGVVSWIWE